MSDQQKRVLKIFRKAIDLPPQEQQHLLERECGDDSTLREQVEAMLDQQGETTDVPQVVPPPPPAPPGSTPVQRTSEDMFESGDVFAGRYRIVSMLGRGAMGEVYRAVDMTLDVPIAIKFVRGTNPRFHERMLHEVRLAREVTHPAVCRVYDVGQQDDRLYLTMEYVDGEDLSSLISRIGRLPSVKVLDIARQICAGLAAAHAKGVIHRDLKPANVMIDGKGNVRITDFGIAVLESDEDSSGFAGTPAYMAPEQFTGGELGPATDLYALGLILSELLTGKPVFSGGSLTEMLKKKMAYRPEPPSAEQTDGDPHLDEIITRSLRRNPSERPQSALAVAAMLPGGDPLGMAVEAGATLKPEAVAAAALDNPVRAAATWVLVALLSVLLGGVLLLADPGAREGRELQPRPPEVLADRAEQVIRAFGYDKEWSDNEWGFVDNSVAGGRSALPGVFWYRCLSPRSVPDFVNSVIDSSALEVEMDVPEAITHEAILVMLDHSGRLVYFHMGPYFGSGLTKTGRSADGFDWSPLLAAAGLEDARLEPRPVEDMPVLSDARAAWMTGPSDPAEQFVRVEAAALRGRPVYFAVVVAEPSADSLAVQLHRRASIRRYVTVPLFVSVLLLALGLGAHNAVRERCDMHGAGVLVVVMLAVEVVAVALHSSNVANPLSSGQLDTASDFITIVTASLGVGLCYIGLEPFVRRRRPQTLIAWSRLLEGRVLDRAIGAGLLFGAIAGAGLALVSELDRLVVPWVGLESSIAVPAASQLSAVVDLKALIGTALGQLYTAVLSGILILFLAVALSHFIKVRWLARVVFVVLLGLVYTVNTGAHLPLSMITHGVPTAVIALFFLYRFGLLAFVAADLVYGLLTAFPMTLDSKLWYAQGGYFAIALAFLIGLTGLLFIRVDRRSTTSN